jgi:phosphoserine aminotransferase
LPQFRPTVAKEDRSQMNVVFVMDDPEAAEEFLALCDKERMVGVKGHRSVGGFRVSLYNAMPFESVKVLTDLMRHFAGKH